MHYWDISELFLFFTFLFWALLYYYFSPLSSSVSLQFFSELFCSLTLLFCIKWATISRDKVVLLDEFMGFNIYLHDRGQFWPGLEMGEFIVFQSIIEKLMLPIQCVSTSGRVGLSYAKFLPRDTEWEGSFEVIWPFNWTVKKEFTYYMWPIGGERLLNWPRQICLNLLPQSVSFPIKEITIFGIFGLLHRYEKGLC